jgi:hypothetical protein
MGAGFGSAGSLSFSWAKAGSAAIARLIKKILPFMDIYLLLMNKKQH